MLSKDIIQRYIVPRKICVCNANKAIAYNVAEATLGLLIIASYKLIDFIMNIREKGVWRDPSRPINGTGTTINGSTIGIVGASTVGREVIKLLKPFDARILIYDPYISEKEAQQLNAERTSLEELFKQSDFVSIHAPMSEETYHMIDERHLKLLRDGAVLVNTSRGRLIDQDALIEECKTERILVALDVTDPEPLPADSPLRKFKNVIITPHISGCWGFYGMKKIGEFTLQALEDFFAGKEVKNQVNLERYDILA
jgi:phosphoglycerate dehydrogenase-like enzyme